MRGSVLAADVLSEIIMEVPGFLVSPRDFSRPWSPIGATTPGPSANERVQRAQEAAFK